MKKRSVAAVVILNIITCGIWGAYWGYVMSRDLQAETGVSKIPPVATCLLLLFVSGAGGALLGYDCNETVNALRAKKGLPPVDNMILWLLLGAFIPLVTMALVQNDVNDLLDRPNVDNGFGGFTQSL